MKSYIRDWQVQNYDYVMYSLMFNYIQKRIYNGNNNDIDMSAVQNVRIFENGLVI